MQLDLNELEVFTTTNDDLHSVFVRHKPTFVYVVSEVELTGDRDVDDVLRLENRTTAFDRLNKEVTWFNHNM